MYSKFYCIYYLHCIPWSCKKDYENTLKESSPQSDNNTTEVINNTTEETVENEDLENKGSE